MIKLTIVVCTYNRSSFLKSCLESILMQVEAYSDIEVLVVDNNSSDDTRSVALQFPNVKYVFENRQGLSYAKNAAVSHSSGEWIAYVDDDAVLREGWVSSIYRTFRNFDFDIFGGPYYPWYKDGKKSWFPDIYGSNTKWLNYRYTQEIEKEVSGGNSVYRKSLLELVKFDTELGMNGVVMAYGEETQLQQQLRSGYGAKVGYVPEMVIDHYTPLDKQNYNWYLRRYVSEGRDQFSKVVGMKGRVKYLLSHFLYFLASPVIALDIYIRNSFQLSVKAVSLEILKPLVKIYGAVKKK